MGTSSEFEISPRRRALINRLWEIGAVRCDGIALKTGELSPVYFNLRLVISDPALLKDLAQEMMVTAEEFVVESGEKLPRLLCGVPYAALPFATCASVDLNIPMIMCRKERKDYSTKQLIEGKFNQGDECLILEDVTAFGTSLGEICQNLREEGLVVNKGVVLIDREQNAKLMLRNKFHIDVKSVFSLSEILQVLVEEGKMLPEKAAEMKNFVQKLRHRDGH